jgi:cyclase
MQSLRENIHIEDKYPGITVGALNLPQGMIYIDAPPMPEDGRTWRADLLDLKSGYERLLINLDSNSDRVIGTRAMDCPTLIQENTAEYYRNRTGIFKNQGEYTGKVWETLPNLGNIRWTPPEITFTNKMSLHWGDTPVELEHHPGADIGALWIILPEEKIVFVGDSVVKNQPPFLERGDLPRWIEDIDLLLSDAYQGYTIVSGRGGVCATSTVEKQRELLASAMQGLEHLAKKESEPAATTKMIPALLDGLRFPAADRELFSHRLRHGLAAYYTRHYLNENEPEED